MSQEQIAEFMEATNSDRKTATRYLQRNDFDVEKAVRNFYGGRIPPKKGSNNWYAGGSESGLAVEIPTSVTGVTPIKPPEPSERPKVVPCKFTPVKTDFVSPDQPKTRIRAQLPDGAILTLSLNTTATVEDIKGYIRVNKPDYGEMKLFAMLPSRELEDRETVESAGIKMGTVRCVLSE